MQRKISQIGKKSMKSHKEKINHVPIKHKQMSFVLNGGKFKLDTVPNGLLFQRLCSAQVFI
jgi:hypothetical protein